MLLWDTSRSLLIYNNNFITGYTTETLFFDVPREHKQKGTSGILSIVPFHKWFDRSRCLRINRDIIFASINMFWRSPVLLSTVVCILTFRVAVGFEVSTRYDSPKRSTSIRDIDTKPSCHCKYDLGLGKNPPLATIVNRDGDEEI